MENKAKFMKEITSRESRSIMVKILKDVTDFCDQYGLIYFLSSGTLIGAIRHKGFIPWDDDIDIEMPRPDYDRFIQLYKENGKYEISVPSDKNSFYFYVKVYDNNTVKIEEGIDYKRFSPLGIDIDVFPIDGQPDEEHFELFKKQTNRRKKTFEYFFSSICSTKNKSLKSLIKIFVCRLFGKDFFCNLYNKSAKINDYATSSMVGFISPYSQYSNRHRKELFMKRVKVQFEDAEYWAPAGHDEYLRNIYGDYMQLPPTDQQKTHHSSKTYWKDKY